MFLFLLIAVVGVVGFVGVFVTASELMGLGFPQNLIMPVLSLGAMMIFAILALLGWLLSRMISLAQQTESQAPPKKISGERRPAPPLAAPPDLIPSVVEPTTRSFEPARYRDPDPQKTPR
jgi:hypothetical protein